MKNPKLKITDECLGQLYRDRRGRTLELIRVNERYQNVSYRYEFSDGLSRQHEGLFYSQDDPRYGVEAAVDLIEHLKVEDYPELYI